MRALWDFACVACYIAKVQKNFSKKCPKQIDICTRLWYDKVNFSCCIVKFRKCKEHFMVENQNTNGFLGKFLGRIGLSKKQAIIRAAGLGLFLVVMVVLFVMANLKLTHLLPSNTTLPYQNCNHTVRSDGWILVSQPYFGTNTVPFGLIVNLILVVVLVVVLITVALKYLFSALAVSGKMGQKSMKITTSVAFGLSAVLFITLLVCACLVAGNNFPSPIKDSATGEPIGVKGGLDMEFNPLLRDFSKGGANYPTPGWGEWYYWFYWTILPFVMVFFAAAVFSGIAFFKGIGIPFFKRLLGKKSKGN